MADFTEVKTAEEQEIKEARRRRAAVFARDKLEMPSPEARDDTAGIAFSGGGIRSATFNLGILQGLARYNLLQRIDYVSTVSGGGYIGSWLISWIRRWGFRNAIRGLASSPSSPPLVSGPPASVMKPAVPLVFDGTYREAPQINFLRAYSNYLTPRLGVLSADVWEAVSSYVRNLLLNLGMLVLSLAAVLLLPRAWEALFLEIAKSPRGTRPAVLLSVAALLLAITVASWNIASYSFPTLLESRFTKQKWVLLLVVAPLFVAAPLGCIALWLTPVGWFSASMGSWAAGGSLVYGLLRFIGVLLSNLWLLIFGPPPPGGWSKAIRESFSVTGWAFVAGPLGGVLVGWIGREFHAWTLASSPPKPWEIARVACWGTPLLIGALLITGVLHIGLMSLQFANEKKEWWARMTGWLLICCLSCAALFGLGIYAPLGVGLLSGYARTKAALIGGWILSTLGGLLAGKSGSTSGTTGSDSKLEILAQVAPYVFVVGLLVALSCGVHSIASFGARESNSDAGVEQNMKVSGELHLIAQDSSCPKCGTLTELKLAYAAKPDFNATKIKTAFWNEVEQSASERHWNPCDAVPGSVCIFLAAMILALAALLLSTRVDINEFSMHLFYRNRLVRCYLGASNDNRKPQMFSGFDPKDDTLLKDFSIGADPYPNKLKDETKEELIEYAGPYPVLNCTLTVTHGERLAWQERKGESFIFTPRFCGYEFQEQRRMKEDDERAAQRILAQAFEGDEHQKLLQKLPKSNGYQPTGGYAYDGGVYLGTALATSGAAVNPNMGFHTSSALAFLLTVFNVRLGWWLGNPQNPKTNNRATPRFGLFYLLMELFALTSDRSRYVNLSDGFHFENLGLYELVRRRCRYIIVGDAGADPEHSFDDLANAIRKCRTDFGIEIEIDLTGLQLDKGKKFSPAHAAAGFIRYDLIEPDTEKGILIYFKPTLTEEDSADIQNYRTAHPVFPHQSTANQWFDESQFESYRQLGRISAETVLKLSGTPDELRSMPTSEVFETLSTLL